MRTNWFHVLAAIAAEPLHGTAIADDVLEQTGGGLRLWPATLYRTLDELSDAALIEELTGDKHPGGESQRKRFYRITDTGRRELADAADQLAGLAGLARVRLRDAGT